MGRRRPRTPIDRLLLPVRDFARTSRATAVTLLAASVVAMALAASPWSEAYERLLEVRLVVGPEGHVLSKPLRTWINDGVMAVFFFVVGLEIKREVLVGELASWRRAALPVFAAVGGMVVPAAFYLALNPSGPASAGWGVPVATDIAFALGALAALGRRVPIALKVFVTALAIADDVGAVLVIALAYTRELTLLPLGIGLAALLASVGANLLGARHPLTYFVLGLVVWLGFLESGVHATLAAVLMAMTIPATPQRPSGAPLVRRLEPLQEALREASRGRATLAPTATQLEALEAIEDELERVTPPLQRLEHVLGPLVSLLVLPLFALANAGVRLDALGNVRVGLGVALGLVVGKQVGILGAAWLAVRTGVAALPRGVSWAQLHGAAALGGIGFTMSIFIANLAFTAPADAQAAKVGILVGSVVSAALGIGVLWRAGRQAASGPAPALVAGHA